MRNDFNRLEDNNVVKNFEKAYVKSLRFLSYRQRSEKEVHNYLFKKGCEEIIITKIIELLKKQKLLDDEEFAKWWIEQRQIHKIKSRFFIKRELLNKGVSQELIEKLLSDSQNDLKSALSVFEKNKNKFKNYSGQEYFQKAASFLQRRGFSWDIIKKVLNKEDSDI